MKRWRIAKRMLAVLGGVFAGLLLLEIGVRMFAPQNPEYYNSSGFMRTAPVFPWLHENIPGGRNDFYIGVRVRINSTGLRGDEISIAKQRNTYRILAIGDSVTFGYGVREEDTFPRLLERDLNEQANSPKFQVLNAGVPATGLDSYFYELQRKGELLNPDLVIVNLCMNDIRTYSEPHPPARHKKARVLAMAVTWLNTALLRHSQLYLALYVQSKSLLYRAGVLDMNDVQEGNLLPIEAESAHQAKAWTSSMQMLQRIVALCRLENYRLAFVVFPMEMQLSPEMLNLYRQKFHIRVDETADLGGPQRRLKEFGVRVHVPVLDLLPAFRAVQGKNLFLRNKSITYDPVHLSEAGHQVAAKAIGEFLPCLLGEERPLSPELLSNCSAR